MVCDDFGDGGPVFEGPLGVEGALGPGDDGTFLAGHGVEVLQGVGDVFSAHLGVGEEGVPDVEVDGVGEGGSREEFADVEAEG